MDVIPSYTRVENVIEASNVKLDLCWKPRLLKRHKSRE